MQNTIKQAIYAVDGKTPEQMKGSVTEEIIADYLKEVLKPVAIGVDIIYIDLYKFQYLYCQKKRLILMGV